MNSISMVHGDGGEQAHQLIQEVFVQAFGNQEEARLDAAWVRSSERIAISTDSFVVKPLFFQGGNIGKLSIAGTVNDVAVSGASPRFITAGFIIEEGFPVENLKRIVQSMAEEAAKSGVKLVAGDTKVVERGSADGLFINTTGIGFADPEISIAPRGLQAGDAIILSGTVGDHGVAILAARGNLGLSTPVISDCASLSGMIADVCRGQQGIRIMRDPTRGGLATSLAEICEDFKVTMELEEKAIPVLREVKGACDLLGFDPLYLANEGKFLLIVADEQKEKVLSALRQHELGKQAAIIGQVTAKGTGKLLLRTPFGHSRRLGRLANMHLPRIC